MPGKKKHKLVFILLSILLFIIVAAGCSAIWLSWHYKRILMKQLPALVTRSTDSIYHISFSDIHVNLLDHKITITDLKLWPDQNQVKAMRAVHRHTPTTLSSVTIPILEASGMDWTGIIDKRSVSCEHAIVHGLKWSMQCEPRPGDSSFSRDKHKNPYLDHVSVTHVSVLDPDVSYHYKGPRSSFSCFMKGGSASLDRWQYNYDQGKDTSVFLYARNGKVRLDSFIFLKKNGRYAIKKPDIDFETAGNTVTLKDVRIKHMENRNPETGAVKEIYDLHFPSIKLVDFNWNKLINDNTLHASEIIAEKSIIETRHIDRSVTPTVRMGSYPHQLLLQVALQINLEAVKITDGRIKYTEVTEKNDEAIIEFTRVQGHFTNITNMDSVIVKHKNCIMKMSGNYLGKSPVSSTFNFVLTDTTGRFSMDGVLTSLDGDQVMKQAQAFTFVEVTSFHLSKMDMHIEGDETYAKGNFTVLYEDLKISLFKFKSDMRKGKHGPLSFLGSALILYPSNPMKDEQPRMVTTSFARDPQKGFVPVLWKNIYRAAQKTAVRNDKLIEMTNEKESVKGETPKKKGFFRRLFSKKR